MLFRSLIYRKNEFSNIEWKEIVQNEYKNNDWCKVASEWVDLLIKELSEIDKENRLPVLVTSQYLLLPLINVGHEDVINKASFYYKDQDFSGKGYIRKEQNKLQRTVIPFFRHCAYILDENEMENRMKNDNIRKRNRAYRESLRNFINREN